MGSRAVVVVCRDEEAARRRFGVADEGAGHRLHAHRAARSSTTRRWSSALLDARARGARRAPASGTSSTPTGCCLDCELMPWSAKAQELLREQYAAVGAAARVGARGDAGGARARRPRADGESSELRRRATASARRMRSSRTSTAYRRYCWPVQSLDDLRLAPFHLLATEGARPRRPRPRLAHGRRSRELWRGRRRAAAGHAVPASSTLDDPASVGGGRRVVGGADRRAAARGWWSSRSTSSRAGREGLVQPAVKCRGREYLRIIYGPEYTAPEQPGAAARARPGAQALAGAARVRPRASRRWSASSRGEPLRRVHECVFGVLALESEPVDPRL